MKLTDSISSAMYFKSPSEMLHYALREACYYDHLEVHLPWSQSAVACSKRWCSRIEDEHIC